MSVVSVQGWVRSVFQGSRALAVTLAGATLTSTANTVWAAETDTLEEVIVVAGGSQVTLPEAYEGGQIARGGRVGMFGNLDIMDTAFTSVSYTAQLIQDQQAKSVADVLQNDPTVRVARGFGNFQEVYIIRGFPVFSDDVTYNGVYGILPRQYVAAELLERVEVFRGANTFLNGAAPGGSGIGGAFNLVPKRAVEQPLTRVTLGFEGEGQAYGTIDIGQRFADGTTGVRLNLVRRDGETSVTDQERELSVASLGMDFRGEQLRLSADFAYQDHRIDTPRPSVTPLGDIPEPPDASSNFAQPWTYTSERQLFGVARGEYDFTRRISMWVAAGVRDGEEFNVLANPNASADGVTSTYRFDNKRDEDLFSADAGVRIEFTTGEIGHRLVFSASRISLESRNAFATSDFFNPLAGNLYQPFAVARPAADFFTGGLLSDPLVTQDSVNSSLAVADMVSLFDERVLLTLGLRQQRIETKSFDYDSGVRLSGYDEDRITPVAAVVFKPSEQVSLYANFAEGLVPGETAPDLSGGTPVINAGEVFDPFRSEQFEVGAKYDSGAFGGVVSLFQTTRPSAFVENRVFAVAGEQRNRGLELSVFGRPLQSLRVLGGFTLIEAELTRTQNGSFDGKDAVGLPDMQGNLNVEWDVAAVAGLALDGRVIYTSSQYANSANTVEVDSWSRLDIGARYQASFGGRTTTFRARLENVTDEAYWASVGGFPGSNYLVLGTPRTLLLSASVDF